MQELSVSWPKTQHIKFYFWRRKKEIEILDALSNSKDNVINVAGKMKLQQELALISNLDVMVSMDSGMLILLLCWE
jgi:ADP-heptose:LPS heptosyltransferase